MKKFGKILFAFIFMFVGLFGMTGARAAGIPVNFYSSAYPNPYSYALTSGADKLDLSIYTGDVTALTEAARSFYNSASGATSVAVVPFELKVKDGETFASTDSATLYVRVPDEFLNISFADGRDAFRHVKLGILTQANSGNYVFNPDYDTDNTYNNQDENVKMQVLKGNLNGTTFTEDANGNYYVKFTTNEANKIFAVVICNAPEYTTTTVTTTVPEETTTTTIENPKTLDGSNSAYIIIGVIGLIGILGLGTKFAKASK